MKPTLKPLALLAVGLLVLVAFGGCRVGRGYTRPDLHLPQDIDGMQSVDTLTIADMAWWEIYTDTTLQQLIGSALAHNKGMLIATSRIREMAARKRIHFSNLFPEVDAKVHAEREQSNDGGTNFVRSDGFEAKALFSWELDLWGRLRWANDAGIAEYVATVEAQRALRLSLIADVAQAYFELVALDNELIIVKQTLEARTQSIRLAKIRFEGGLTSETAYQQAQLEYARTATLVPGLEQRISQKENELAFLAGRYPGKIERSLLLQEFCFPDSLPVGIPSDLLERRPDIHQAEQQLIAANAQVGMALTAMFPRISLTGMLGGESSELSDLLSSPYSFVDATLLSPLFAMGRNRAQYKAAKEVLKQQGYRYEQTVLNAFREVSNAIVAYGKAQDVYELSLSFERSAKSHVDLAQLQYINGVINYLDVLDAQRGYFDAQIGLSNAVRDELIGLVQLYRVLGGGF